MRLFFATLLLTLAACATNLGPNYALATGYNLANAYAAATEQRFARRAITVDQAKRASAKAHKLKEDLDTARAMLARCAAPPCADFNDMMLGLQPALLELEAELRQQQGDKQ